MVKIGKCSLCYNDVIQCCFNSNNKIETVTFCEKCKNDAVIPLVIRIENGVKIVTVKEEVHWNGYRY